MVPSVKFFADRIDKKYPFTFVDIGAMGGIPRKWDLLSEVMNIMAFEPDSREFQKLKSVPRTTYFNYALYNRSQNLKFYLTKEAGKSSIYKPNADLLSFFEDTDRFDVVKEEDLPSARVKSLDDIFVENNIPDVDFIKIDTQGSELAILQGGHGKVLPQLFGLNVEMEFVEMYKGQPLFRDVDRYLYDNDFRLIDMRRYYWKRKDYYNYLGKGQLVLGDALYFKDIDVWLQDLKRSASKEYVSSKIYKGILICMVYKTFDYAVSLAKAGLRDGYLPEESVDVILKEIKDFSHRGAVYNFPGKYNLYRVFNFVCQQLKPPSYLGWADSDTMIANIKDK